ncbi:hypothetical protein L596_028304 [Steinernema carpocapsae]|uniref:Uncharacterized protein n=1 Tax=Steinernema carpocapsae TaxID=34508 RepID=A0A4U5LY58_STECR|nr:hypothetical protein L596_028304 [Steinernema carpocapsae]
MPRTVARLRLFACVIFFGISPSPVQAYKKGVGLRGPPTKAPSANAQNGDIFERREFVRMSWADDDPRYTFKKKTFSKLKSKGLTCR